MLFGAVIRACYIGFRIVKMNIGAVDTDQKTFSVDCVIGANAKIAFRLIKGEAIREGTVREEMEALAPHGNVSGC